MQWDPKPALFIKDLRSNHDYTIPIQNSNYVDATSFSSLKDANGVGLVVHDEGSRNVACIRSDVSHL